MGSRGGLLGALKGIGRNCGGGGGGGAPELLEPEAEAEELERRVSLGRGPVLEELKDEAEVD